jgi:hypothetical protein
LPFSFARRFNFYILRCKGKLKVKNQFASGSSKKSSRYTIRKTFRTGSAETLKEPGFVSWEGLLDNYEASACNFNVPRLCHSLVRSVLYSTAISRQDANLQGFARPQGFPATCVLPFAPFA